MLMKSLAVLVLGATVCPGAGAVPSVAAAKPVQVYILMGQSIMLGEGSKDKSLKNAVQAEGKYPYLWDAATGKYTVSKNVRNVFLMASGGATASATLFNNEFMTAAETTPAAVPGLAPKNKNSIGPELGIGFALGNYTTDPVMCLKSCIGGRSLGWDLLPPGPCPPLPGYPPSACLATTWCLFVLPTTPRPPCTRCSAGLPRDYRATSS